jgi:hypothetical protein
MNYENTIIDNQAILEFRDGVEREVRFCTDALKRMAQKNPTDADDGWI